MYDSEVDNGLGGRLEIRDVFFEGGRGNAPMLETFRRLGKADGVCDKVGDRGGSTRVVFTVGTAEADCDLLGFGVGKADVVTDRALGFEGVGKPDGVLGRSSSASGMTGSLVLETGNDGKGFEGGAIGGREGRYTVVVDVMVAVAVMLLRRSAVRRHPAAFHKRDGRPN